MPSVSAGAWEKKANLSMSPICVHSLSNGHVWTRRLHTRCRLSILRTQESMIKKVARWDPGSTMEHPAQYLPVAHRDIRCLGIGFAMPFVSFRGLLRLTRWLSRRRTYICAGALLWRSTGIIGAVYHRFRKCNHPSHTLWLIKRGKSMAMLALALHMFAMVAM